MFDGPVETRDSPETGTVPRAQGGRGAPDYTYQSQTSLLPPREESEPLSTQKEGPDETPHQEMTPECRRPEE